ncbi:MAG: hypothetical protein ABSC19_07430 [Syntrophorhabdales bacterium]
MDEYGGYQLKKTVDEVIAASNRQTLRGELSASGLSEISQRQVERRLMTAFAGKVITAEEVREQIVAEKSYLSGLAGGSSGRVSITSEEPERVQAAFDKLFGVEVDDKFRQVQPFSSLRAAYTRFTGDEEMRGMPTPEAVKFGESFMQWMRLPAAYSTASFTYALGNTMYRRLVQEYKAVDYGEQYLISYERNAPDFRPQNSILLGYFSDLPDVNPELLDYNEIGMIDDAEVSYFLNQKGTILTIMRKTLINDDIKTIETMVKRLGRAAKRTFARRGWNLLINNATYQPDAYPVFCSQHGNLGSITLTNDATGIGSLTAAKTALYSQTEKDSGETLAFNSVYEAVPRALLEIALALNQPWPMGGIFNPHAGTFGMHNERIITVALFTDPYDWYLIGDRNDVELLEVGLLSDL